MRLRQRTQAAFEFFAFRLACAAKGLHGDGLENGQRILDAVIELLDQEVMQPLAAGNYCRHPQREGETD